MNDKNYTTTIEVSKSPMQVFDAINHVSDWWQGEIKGNTTKLNDEFTYRMKEFHVSKQKIVEMVPGKKIVWLVTESNLNFIKDSSEWNGTKISFEISEKNGKTQVCFTHYGLIPEVECYNACSNGWGQLVQQSLFNFMENGKGKKVF